MAKVAWGVGIVLVLLLGGGALYFVTKDSGDDTSIMSVMPPAASDEGVGSSGQYIPYTSDVIAKTPGTKILFFHAPWCPQCRALEKSINEGRVPEGVTIIKVDYDSNQALRQQYGVTIQTSLVRVDDAGNLVERYVAYDDPTLQALVDNLL